jgi:hypothetical protein
MFIEHVAAGLTTAGIITAARNRGSLVLLFASKAKHYVIHEHNRGQHPAPLHRCTTGDCNALTDLLDLQTSLSAE